MNYFNILNLEVKYDINSKLLEDNYLQLQLSNHPDRNISSLEKLQSLEYCMNINQAYTTLKNDIKRAEHLLELNNIKVEHNFKPSQFTLLKSFEDQEAVENLNNVAVMEKFYHIKDLEYKELISNISIAFGNKNFNQALEIVMRLKYLTKLLENIKLKIKHANN